MQINVIYPNLNTPYACNKNRSVTSAPKVATSLAMPIYADAMAYKAKYLYTPSFKSTTPIYKKHEIYDPNNYFAKTYSRHSEPAITASILLLKNKDNKILFDTTDKVEKLMDSLRDGEVRETQLKLLKYLATKNPKFKKVDEITTLVSQVNTVERGNLFIQKIDEYTKRYPNMTTKDMVSIIPRLEKEKIETQEKFIDRIYNNKNTSQNINLDLFSGVLSSIEDPEVAQIQLDTYDLLTKEKSIQPSIVLELISNFDHPNIGLLKKNLSFLLLNKGIEQEDLPILIPKAKNNSVAAVQLKMADYFISERKMNSNTAAKIMSNIQKASVFNMQKNIIEDMSKLRKFEDEDTLKILGDIQTPEMADLKMAVINELAKIDKLDGHDIMHIVTNVDNVYNAEIKVKTANELAQIKELNGKNIGYIVAGCHNEENSRVKCRASKELVEIKGMTGDAVTTIASRLLKDETADIQIQAVKEIIEKNVFQPEDITKIVRGMRNIDFKNAKINAMDKLLENKKLNPKSIVKILDKINGESKDKYLLNCIDKMTKNPEFDGDDITKIATTMTVNKHTCNNFIDYFAAIPKDIRKDINDYSVVQDFKKFKDMTYLDKKERRELLQSLIKHNSQIFDGQPNAVVRKLYPFLPSNNEEFCALLPLLAASETITKNIPNKMGMAIELYPEIINKICAPNSEFLNIDFEKKENIPTLKYSRKNFTTDLSKALEGLSSTDKKRVASIYGISLTFDDKKDIVSFEGYPHKPTEIPNFVNSDRKIISATHSIGRLVDNFINKNQVNIKGSKELNRDFNTIFNAIPELYTLVEKKQNEWHHFDTFTHTLRVLQEVAKNDRFDELNKKDKTLLATAALLHDVSKKEYEVDKGHALNGAYDAHAISQRLDFSNADKSKLFAIIRNHEWLKYYNKEGASKLQKVERAKHVAFTLREGNAFEMVSILSEADLKGLQKNNASYELFKDAQKDGNNEVARYIRDLQRTAIPLPQDKLPKASELIADGKVVRDANIGGIKNKVIYLDKSMGKGSLPFNKNLDPNDFNVLVHALDSEKNSLIFQRMDEVDSDTLISASYVNLAKGNWKTFRQQGFILDVDSDNIHAAYYKDFGSGLSKNIDRLKLDYLYEGYFKPQRDYISRNIKETLHISDESYKSLYQDIKNKSLTDIRKNYPFVSSAIKKIYMDMQGGEYTYGRNYNEVLVTRPKIQGVFAYDRSITQVPKYLRKYAQDQDIPVIIFLD